MDEGSLPLRRAGRSLLGIFVSLTALVCADVASAQAPDAHVLIYSGTVAHRHNDTINQGIGPIQNALDDVGISYDWENCGEIAAIPSCHSSGQNDRIFTDENLAQYDAIFLFNAGGNTPQPLFTQSDRDAIQNFVNAGGGIAANHLATDMGAGQPSWGWWDGLGNSALGSTMPGHPFAPQTATAHISDRNHPSTRGLPDTIQHSDEHYSFHRSVRGTHHVLATLDETTYDTLSGGGGGIGPVEMGHDHPISWCRLYDGGRIWATAMGHFPNLYTANGGDNYLIDHIVGGVQWAAGVAGDESDCGGTVWSNFRRTTLSTEAQGPIGLDVDDDGKVYWTEIGPQGLESFGRLKMWDPDTGETALVAEIPTRADALSTSEDGVLGMALHPEFEQNRQIYVYYSPRGEGEGWPMVGSGLALGYNRISRFTLNEAGTEIVSEQPILHVPKVKVAPNGDGVPNQPSPNWPAHSGGAGLDFDSEGNLYLGVGDDVNPFGEGQDGYGPMDPRYPHRYDARNTAANTNDLRGKILRITPMDEIAPGAEPELGETYTVPQGNMFAPGTPETRPEIYAMGFRQPFTLDADVAEPGTVVVGEYGPDSNANSATRGPSGIIEWNHITGPGFYGWPLCTGDNSQANSYNRWTYPSGPSGERYDCNTAQIANESPNNSGLDQLPGPAEPADIWHKRTGDYPEEFGLPPGAAHEPNSGAIYRYDADNPSETKWPAYYDGSWLILNRAHNWWREVRLTDSGDEVLRVNDFFQPGQFGSPNHNFPIPVEFGPDGSLYMGLWTGGCCRPLSEQPGRIIRIDYVGDQQDETAPTVTATVSGPEHEGKYVDRATVEIEASDELAGVEKVEYSLDGGEWTPVDNADFAEPFTANVPVTGIGAHEVAYRATDRSGNESEQGSVSFRVVGAGECSYGLSDEFSLPEIDTDRWTVRVDDPGFEATVEDGQLVLPILDEIDGTRTGPLAFVGQQVPDGDWSATTRVTIDHNTNWEQGGLMLWQSDGNFIKLGFTADNTNPDRRFELTADDPTDIRHFSTSINVGADFPTTAWVRLFREGNLIGGQVAADEGGAPGEWMTMPATRAVSGEDPDNGAVIDPPREGDGVLVGPYAGGEADPPWANSAAFDFVRFEPDELSCPADTTAPETEALIDGAAPQGSYPGPVDVGVTASDGQVANATGVELTEHRVDGGAWVPHQNAAGDDPFETELTVSDDGAHTVEFRSTDAAGNAEDVGVVSFTLGPPGTPSPGPSPFNPATPAVDVDPPSKGGATLARLLGRGIVVGGGCSGVESGTIELSVVPKVAKRLGLGKRTTLASSPVSCSGGEFSARLKAKGKAKRALKGHDGSLRATLTASFSGAGGKASDSAKVKLSGIRRGRA
jgi:glucose/arabinose dehydrogenase/type 1 glutamine amidotransferase